MIANLQSHLKLWTIKVSSENRPDLETPTYNVCILAHALCQKMDNFDPLI